MITVGMVKNRRQMVGPGRVTLVAVAVALALAVNLQWPQSAEADVWPYGGYNASTGQAVVGTTPDRGTYHTYCYDNANPPNSAVEQRIESSETNIDSQTDIDVLKHSSCTSNSDVRWRQAPLGTPGDHIYGQTYCLSVNSSGKCAQWSATVWWAEIERDASDPGAQARKTSCHELGHTAGLAHYGNYDPYGATPDAPPSWAHSCMRSGIWDDGSSQYRLYGLHHIGHINAYW